MYKEKILFAGPFVGEFGFELLEWQGYIREMSKKFDKTIICSKESSEFLYKDFCNEFVPFDVKRGWTAGWTCYGYKYKGGLHEKYNPTLNLYLDDDSEARNFFKDKKKKFISYNKKNKKYNFDLVFHARMINNGDSVKKSRNWSHKKWDDLFILLKNKNLKIASIGLSNNSLYIDGTENMIDLKLEELSQVLSSSKAIIGPSSGPMHFASLCECPQIVWGSDDLEQIYKIDWNPLNTKVFFCENSGWDPNVDCIYEKICNSLEI